MAPPACKEMIDRARRSHPDARPKPYCMRNNAPAIRNYTPEIMYALYDTCTRSTILERVGTNNDLSLSCARSLAVSLSPSLPLSLPPPLSLSLSLSPSLFLTHTRTHTPGFGCELWGPDTHTHRRERWRPRRRRRGTRESTWPTPATAALSCAAPGVRSHFLPKVDTFSYLSSKVDALAILLLKLTYLAT